MKFKASILSLLMLMLCVDAATQTIALDQDGGDTNTYKGTHDYMDGSVNVQFEYEDIDPQRLKGTVTATGLKPGFTYQVKLLGKPTCLYGVNGNDDANEYIGYKGRWTCADCSGTALSRNRNDAQYEANSHYRGDGSECIQGYLVFDFFTTDSEGDAVKSVESDSSYHVLYCNGGVCGSASNSQLDGDGLCAASDVEGQIERGSCGSLVLDEGEYDVVIALTEESFHQGDWATVLQNDDLEFTIGEAPEPDPIELDYMNIGVPESEDGHNLESWGGLWDGLGNYGGADDGTFRTVIPENPDCQQDDKHAYFSMQADGFADTLELRHLMGGQNDEYNLYIKDGGEWIQLTPQDSVDEVCVGGECWYTDLYAVDGRTGELEFKIEATLNPIPSWCQEWGLNAFSWARITGRTAIFQTPEFTGLTTVLLAMLLAPAFMHAYNKRS